MKDIFIILFDLKIGGIEMSSINTANGFSKRGYNVTIICLCYNPQLLKLISPNVNVVYISNLKPNSKSILYKIKWRLIANLKLRRFLKRIHDSVIISTTNYFSLILSRLKKNGNIRIAQQHSEHKEDKRFINDIRYNYQGIDYLQLLTNDAVKEIECVLHDYPNTPKPICIPNILSDVKDSSEGSHSIAIPNAPFCVSVGRLSVEKGFERLIKIWAEVNRLTSGKLKLYIIGEGQRRNNIEHLISSMNLQGVVKLLGSKENSIVRQYMSNAVCYCMPSYSETFGIVLIEAMSVGLPQVSFDVRFGPKNLIDNNKTGYLIPDGDTMLFTKKVVDIFINPDLRSILSKNSILKSISFSEEKIISEWEKIINIKC